MPSSEVPLRYRSRRDLPPFNTPDGLLSPFSDDTDPALDPGSAFSQPEEPSTPAPSTPREDPMPKPAKMTDTQAGASLEKLPPLNPNQQPDGNYNGLKKLMPPPGETQKSPATTPQSVALGDLDRTPATELGTNPIDTSPVTPATPSAPSAEERRAAIEASRPEAPKSNWAQRIGLAILAMSPRLAPVANQIIHPKWSEQEGAYQRNLANEAQLEKLEETESSTAANVALKQAQEAQKKAQGESYQEIADTRRANAIERTRQALIKSGATMINPGEQAPPGYVQISNPGAPEEHWVRPPSFVPLPQEMLEYFPGMKAGQQVSNEQYQKGLNELYAEKREDKKAENRPEKPLAPNIALAARSAGVDPSKPVEQWSPEEAKRVQDALAKQAQQIHVHAGTTAAPTFSADQLRALTAPLPEGQQTNEAFFKTLPADEQNIVKAISEYRYPIPQGGFAMRDPKWKKVVDDVMAYDPTFSSQQYQMRQKLQNDFTSGVSSRNIRSLNTVAHHIGVLNDMAEAMKNNDMQLYNRLANFLATQTGDPRVTNFNLAKTAVAGELATAFKGQATDAEIKQWMDGINTAGSPEQLRGAVTTPISLIAGRLHAFESQYKDVMGKDKQFLSPQAAQTLQKLAGGGGAQVQLKDGRTANFPSQQAADAFRKDHPDKVK